MPLETLPVGPIFPRNPGVFVEPLGTPSARPWWASGASSLDLPRACR